MSKATIGKLQRCYMTWAVGIDWPIRDLCERDPDRICDDVNQAAADRIAVLASRQEQRVVAVTIVFEDGRILPHDCLILVPDWGTTDWPANVTANLSHFWPAIRASASVTATGWLALQRTLRDHPLDRSEWCDMTLLERRGSDAEHAQEEDNAD